MTGYQDQVDNVMMMVQWFCFNNDIIVTYVDFSISSPEAGLDPMVSRLKLFNWFPVWKADVLHWCNVSTFQFGGMLIWNIVGKYLHPNDWAKISSAHEIGVGGKNCFIFCPHVYSDLCATVIFWSKNWVGNSLDWSRPINEWHVITLIHTHTC